MPISHHQHIQTFLDNLQFQKRYSPHTIISYKNDLNNFFDFLDDQYPDTSISQINAIFIRTWLAGLKEKEMESKTINRKISALKSFFNYFLKQGMLLNSPMSTIFSIKIKKRLTQFVSEKDMGTLFNDVEFSDDWNGKTNLLIFQLLYNTGIRQAELLNLSENNIDKGNGSLKVLGKGNKERILPISTLLMEHLQQYITAKRTELPNADLEVLLVNEKGKKLYPKYIYNVVSKHLALVTTIDKKSPHVMRHSFATHLMSGGADINAVKELLGHSSLAATQVYMHNTIERLKNVHNKSHPKA